MLISLPQKELEQNIGLIDLIIITLVLLLMPLHTFLVIMSNYQLDLDHLEYGKIIFYITFFQSVDL